MSPIQKETREDKSDLEGKLAPHGVSPAHWFGSCWQGLKHYLQTHLTFVSVCVCFPPGASLTNTLTTTETDHRVGPSIFDWILSTAVQALWKIETSTRRGSWQRVCVYMCVGWSWKVRSRCTLGSRGGRKRVCNGGRLGSDTRRRAKTQAFNVFPVNVSDTEKAWTHLDHRRR